MENNDGKEEVEIIRSQRRYRVNEMIFKESTKRLYICSRNYSSKTNEDWALTIAYEAVWSCCSQLFT